MRVSTHRNPPLLVAAAGLRFALYPIPIITLFWKDHIGLSLTEIMGLQAIFGASVVVFEFPTGYVADRMGYRRSLLAGGLFWVTGWMLYALATTFSAVVLAEVLLGIGMAFVSGADSALLFVSLEARGEAARYRQWEGRVRAASQASEALSASLGGWMYTIAPRLPFWMEVPTALVGLGAIGATSEVKRRPSMGRISHLAHAWHIVRHALIHHARLRTAMVLSVTLGISTYIGVWLIQPWMQQRGIPIGWFGPIWALAHLWLAAVSLLSARLADRLGLRPTLLACCVIAGTSYLGLAMSSSAAGVFFYLGLMTVRGLQGPLLASVLQADAPDEDRASVLSLNALLFRLAGVFVLPPVGAAGDSFGLNPVLGLVGALSLISAVAAWIWFSRAHSSIAD
jgi:MFS family permease